MLPALGIMAAGAFVLLLLLLLALQIEARRHRQRLARQQPLDRQLLRAARSRRCRGARRPARSPGSSSSRSAPLLVLLRRDEGLTAMLRITADADHGCLVLEPTGPLSRRDLEALTERFDAWVAAHEGVPNLVIRGGELSRPGPTSPRCCSTSASSAAITG